METTPEINKIRQTEEMEEKENMKNMEITERERENTGNRSNSRFTGNTKRPVTKPCGAEIDDSGMLDLMCKKHVQAQKNASSIQLLAHLARYEQTEAGVF